MNDKTQRQQWAEHLRDEAGAIAQQQVSAGDTHTPMEGPLPHTRADTAEAAQDAVLQERERCAAVAESFAHGERLEELVAGGTQAPRDAAVRIALQIAAAIRARPGPP